MTEDYIDGLIKAVVTRCTATCLGQVLRRWGRVGPEELAGREMRGTKVQVCSTLQDISKRDRFSREIAGDLELAYMQLNSTKKLWKVFKLKGGKLNVNIDPRSLRSKLVRSLQVKKTDGTVDGNMSLFAGALWFRLHIHTHNVRRRGAKRPTNREAYNHSSSIFVVTFPGSPVFIMSRGGIKSSSMIIQAMKEVTNADRVVDACLSGQHVASLADLALRTQQQPDDKYRKMEEQENPLAAQANRKRKSTNKRPASEDLPNVVDEMRQEKRRRRDALSRMYGAGEQPVLEKLEYKFDVKYPGPNKEETTCRALVQIKGKSVLEGLSTLAKEGFVKFPLPRHLSSVVSLSQNSFSIKDKSDKT